MRDGFATLQTAAVAGAMLTGLGAASAPALEIQGHRGARGLAPENTLEGFAVALAIGVHTLELDVGMTRDGVVVVHHDPTLNPNTTRDADGQWLNASQRTPLREMTLSQLQALDVGGIRPGTGYARRFASQRPVARARIPTLAEVCALLRQPGAGHVRLNVEAKMAPEVPGLTPDPHTFADAVVKVLRDEGMADRSTIQAFDWRVLLHVQRTAPGIPTGYLSAQRPRENTLVGSSGAPSPWTAGLRLEDHGGSVPDLVHGAGGRVWSPNHRDLAPEPLTRARALGLRVVVWTVNESRDMRRLVRMGVDGIISDYPDRVREAAAKLGVELPPPVPARHLSPGRQ